MGGALVRVSPQALHLDQGLSFRDEALIQKKYWAKHSSGVQILQRRQLVVFPYCKM